MNDESVRNQARSKRVGREAGVVGTPEARRMMDRLDESGAPVVDGVSGGVKGNSPVSPPVTGASVNQPMGNAQLDPEVEIESEIRARAYERYCSRGYEPGHEAEDWVEAEKEVRGRLWSRGSGSEAPL
jgi:hypothetical protein